MKLPLRARPGGFLSYTSRVEDTRPACVPTSRSSSNHLESVKINNEIAVDRPISQGCLVAYPVNPSTNIFAFQPFRFDLTQYNNVHSIKPNTSHTHTRIQSNQSQSIIIYLKTLYQHLPSQFQFYVHNGILPWSSTNYTLMVVGLQPETMRPFRTCIASNNVQESRSDRMDSRNCHRRSKRAGRCKCCQNPAHRW